MRNILLFLSILLVSDCSGGQDNLSQNESDLIVINKNAEGDLVLIMKNRGNRPIHFFDSLFFKDERIPFFLFFKGCTDNLVSCNENKWMSPHFRNSSVIRPPVVLAEIAVEEEFVKHIDLQRIIIMSYQETPRNIQSIKLKVRVYFDTSLTEYREYQSDWIPCCKPR